MVSGGEEVVLHGGVTLDMRTVNQYDGKGECERVVLFDDAHLVSRYPAQEKSPATRSEDLLPAQEQSPADPLLSSSAPMSQSRPPARLSCQAEARLGRR